MRRIQSLRPSIEASIAAACGGGSDSSSGSGGGSGGGVGGESRENASAAALALQSFSGLRLNEFNANSYEREKGHFLREHVDDRFLSGPILANLSLLDSCSMRYMAEKSTRCVLHGAPTSADVWLPRRCLQIVSGPARYDYSHSIPTALLGRQRRVSLTFRQAGHKKYGVRAAYVGGTMV